MLRYPVSAWFAAVLCCVPAGAHHGPEEMIAAFTKRIEASGPTPVLLYKRATEWRILGKLDEAIVDLKQAVELNPKFAGGLELLAEVYLAKGDIENAKAVARDGIATTSGSERAGCSMVLARALQADGKPVAALEACNAAFTDLPRGDIDWYLIRGSLQRELGRHDERIAGFQKGHAATGSIVLRIAAIEALIDAGRAREVMPVMDEYVNGSRLKSSWLLRRGRAHLSLGNSVQGRADLEAALAELERRIHPTRPDVSLIADRGLARALLGDAGGARIDLELVRKQGGSEWMLTLLVEALANQNLSAPVSQPTADQLNRRP